jgi:hypothetical protein
MKKWLDKYEASKAQNGIEGTMGGLTDKGFNYNGAWGGTMQMGGKLTAEQLESLNLAKMRSKMALAAEFGNPSAKRMASVSPSSYRFSGNEMIDGKPVRVRPGETGTHYMSSMGEYAVPYIQEGPNGKLQFKPNASFRDREAIRFDNPKDAEYFAEHYKEVAPMMRQYAMGGSLPGAVGFTYARTGDIPSNGPYAKKTKASAQNGRAVSDNTRLKPIVTEKPMNRETVRSTKPFEAKDNRSIFNDSRAKDRMNNEYSQYVQNIYKDTFIDQIPYAAPVLAAKAFNEGLPFTALSELIKQPLGVVGDAAINAIQENPESIDVKTLEEKTIPYTRLAANATFGNPVITQIGKQRVESGKKKGSKWYDFTAYELPALMDAANSYGVDDNTFTQFIEDNWKSSGGSYKKILELADKKFSKKQNGGDISQIQLGAQDGKNVEYMELPEITVVGSKDKGTRDFYNNLIDTFSKGRNTNNPFVNQEVMGDYLGVMNLGKEYGFPKVKPETKSGIYKNARGHYNPLTKTIYSNDPDNWVAEMAHHVQMKDNVVGKGLQWLGNDLVQYLKKPAIELRNAFKYGIDSSPLDYTQEDFNEWSNTSPYEKEGTVEHEAHRVIEPMLKEKIRNTLKDYKNSSVSEASKKRFLYETRNLQNGGEMKYYQEGLDWKPRNISEDGSIITSYGQWEYPGEITTIPSNEITMEGVPYPVLGISDTGDTQMMYPEEEYEFDGESVTEYPVMQKGGRVPVYTENPRDPRLKAYQDSLKLHNLSLKIANRPNGDISYGRKPEGKFNKNFTAADAMEYLYPVTPDEIAMSKLSNKSKILPTRHYPGEAGGVHFKKPVQPVQYRKPEPKKEQPVKKIEKPKPVERKQNVYEGSPVYSPGTGSGLPSALIGFANQQGDTTYIKPEDYERFAVPKYGKEFIESKKKQRNGGVNSADAQPIKKLDQLLNFTNYNKPSKGGWLDKYN